MTSLWNVEKIETDLSAFFLADVKVSTVKVSEGIFGYEITGNQDALKKMHGIIVHSEDLRYFVDTKIRMFSQEDCRADATFLKSSNVFQKVLMNDKAIQHVQSFAVKTLEKYQTSLYQFFLRQLEDNAQCTDKEIEALVLCNVNSVEGQSKFEDACSELKDLQSDLSSMAAEFEQFSLKMKADDDRGEKEMLKILADVEQLDSSAENEEFKAYVRQIAQEAQKAKN